MSEKTMIIVEKLSRVAGLLLYAAKTESTSSMKTFHNLFSPNTPVFDRNCTLEASARALADFRSVIYSAVLAKIDHGIPGDGFYDAFINCKRDDHIALVGDKRLNDLTIKDKIKIVTFERHNVYNHANEFF